MRVIVTRPAAQAADWVLDLRGHGIDAVALPLISIEAVADAAPLVDAWRTLAQRRLVVFVSPNAAQHFFARRPEALGWPPSVLAGSPGPGTTRALIELGVPAAQIVEPAPGAAQFDSESLWVQLQPRDWCDADVLIVRGDGGRDWLADTLRQHGARVDHLSAYQRAAPRLDADERAVLQAALESPSTHVWFFSSSEAIAHLQTLVAPGTGWAGARAIGTHPRIVAAARQCGFADVVECRPSLAAVVACIQSIAT